MPDPRSIVVVGSINVDITAAAERLPAPGETIGGAALHREAGGKGANQAAAASRLGARVRMVGAVGDDPDGEWMLHELREAGVGVADVRRVSAPTGTALIVVDRQGENQIVVCPGANAAVSLPDVRIGDDEIVLTQLEIELDVVLELARGTRAFLAVNAAPARPLPAELVERADLIIVNESEYALMPELAEARLVAVTYGAQGAALLTRGVERARVPAVPARAVNTVGAGDAFCAALTMALTGGAEPEEALRLACAVGAAAVAHPGSQPPFAPLAAYAEGAPPAWSA